MIERVRVAIDGSPVDVALHAGRDARLTAVGV
jgi:hypothetical protein